MTISVRFLSVVRALRSFLERLLRIGAGLQVMMSFSITLMKASRAASLPLGGVHVPLHLKRFVAVVIQILIPFVKKIYIPLTC